MRDKLINMGFALVQTPFDFNVTVDEEIIQGTIESEHEKKKSKIPSKPKKAGD